MDKAVARIQQARDRGEHVLVFGDYDVDGIAGTAILVSAFRRIGIAKCSYGMPHRLMEGYGLSPDRVQWAKEMGAQLIVTADNGTAANDAEMARSPD
jgi:single-stranded-DNA-specific exonuclease